MAETIRTIEAADVDTIKRIAIDTNMFAPDDVGFFDQLIPGFLDGTQSDHQWLAVEADDGVVAADRQLREVRRDFQ